MTNNLKLKIFTSNSHNPWFNLATEDWLFQDLDDFHHVLFLWRNAKTVVIGRSQNPWAECHLQNMQRDEVKLARRQSGGGAVYQDMGNTNFTLLSRNANYDKSVNFQIIQNALNQFDIDAQLSGRNDLVVQLEDEPQQRKISGSAFKQKVDRAFHHGTLLINADLQRLQEYLNPNKKKLEAKGIKSVRSRVINLQEMNVDISHDPLCQAIIQAFCDHHQTQADVVDLDHQRLATIPELQAHYQKLQSWDWLYGQTLEFTHQFDHRFDWGTVEFQFLVKNAVIKDLRIYSDSLYPDMIDELAKALVGKRYDADDIQRSIKNVADAMPEHAIYLVDLSEFVVNELRRS